MHSNFSYISNSTVMLVLCIITVIAVLCQALYFMRVGFKRGKEFFPKKKDKETLQ